MSVTILNEENWSLRGQKRTKTQADAEFWLTLKDAEKNLLIHNRLSCFKTLTPYSIFLSAKAPQTFLKTLPLFSKLRILISWKWKFQNDVNALKQIGLDLIWNDVSNHFHLDPIFSAKLTNKTSDWLHTITFSLSTLKQTDDRIESLRGRHIRAPQQNWKIIFSRYLTKSHFDCSALRLHLRLLSHPLVHSLSFPFIKLKKHFCCFFPFYYS